jgi:hypothetical protein
VSECGFAAESVGVVADGDQQCGHGVWSEPEYGAGGRGGGSGEFIELRSQRAGFDVEMLNALGDGAQGVFGGLDGIGEVGRVGTQTCAGVDELCRGQGTQLGAQWLRGGDDHRAQGVERGGAGLDRAVAGDA